MKRGDAAAYAAVAMLLVLLLSGIISVQTYRVPSDSMMPALLDGDYMLVNQAAYGLRFPFTHKPYLTLSHPQRGDVVVFRYPRNPSVTYVKRVVGLPGDHVQVHRDQLTINGTPVPFNVAGNFNDGCYINLQRARERLDKHTYDVLFCPLPLEVSAQAPASCDRRGLRGYSCPERPGDSVARESGLPADAVVPAGQYFVVGDNRDNSEDSRIWGFVPEENLVGKAVVIWFNWDLQRRGGPNWQRFGQTVH